MVVKQGRKGFTLAELLVVIAIIGILAGFLMPVVGNARHAAKIAMAGAMVSNIKTALAEYKKDTGVYPPEYVGGALDKCSETLYFYLSGCDVDSPKNGVLTSLRKQRENAKVYLDFKKKELDDHDNDGYYEVVDPWGNPYIYVRGSYPGKPYTGKLGEKVGSGTRPFHHRSSYDLYSVGPDGKTGTHWKDYGARMLEYDMNSANSFYKQAADEMEDGVTGDDISNN